MCKCSGCPSSVNGAFCEVTGDLGFICFECETRGHISINSSYIKEHNYSSDTTSYFCICPNCGTDIDFILRDSYTYKDLRGVMAGAINNDFIFAF